MSESDEWIRRRAVEFVRFGETLTPAFRGHHPPPEYGCYYNELLVKVRDARPDLAAPLPPFLEYVEGGEAGDEGQTTQTYDDLLAYCRQILKVIQSPGPRQ